MLNFLETSNVILLMNAELQNIVWAHITFIKLFITRRRLWTSSGKFEWNQLKILLHIKRDIKRVIKRNVPKIIA